MNLSSYIHTTEMTELTKSKQTPRLQSSDLEPKAKGKKLEASS
jgi:hypothetical protein